MSENLSPHNPFTPTRVVSPGSNILQQAASIAACPKYRNDSTERSDQMLIKLPNISTLYTNYFKEIKGL